MFELPKVPRRYRIVLRLKSGQYLYWTGEGFWSDLISDAIVYRSRQSAERCIAVEKQKGMADVISRYAILVRVEIAPEY